MVMLPTIDDIQKTFKDAISVLGGNVTDSYRDGELLLLRSTSPTTQFVGSNDAVNGGVALRTDEDRVHVHPYVFRQVCCNGAIWAHAIDTFTVERADSEASHYEIENVLDEIHHAVLSCAQATVLHGAVDQMRRASDVPGEVDMLLNLMSMLPRSVHAREIVAEITRRFQNDGDNSAFGMMNAVTSVARDTHSPRTRWRLEELGGSIPALVRPKLKPSGTAAALV